MWCVQVPTGAFVARRKGQVFITGNSGFPKSHNIGLRIDQLLGLQGFKGKSEFILVVENPYGIKVKQNARVAQLIFFRINKTEEGYKGIYQEHY